MKKWSVFLIIFFIILIVLIATTYKDYGIAWDESSSVFNGLYYLHSLFNNLNISFNNFQPNVGHLKTHGVFFDILTMMIAIIFNKITYEFIHLIKALTAIFAYLFTVLTVNKLLNKKAALFAAILLLLFPRFYGSIFFSPIDVPAAVLFSLTVFYFIHFIKSDQSPTKQIILGLIMALTINQRIIFWYLFLVNFIVLYFIQRKKIPLIFFSQLFFMHLTHPYLFQHPVIGIIQMIYTSINLSWNGQILFSSIVYSSAKNLPWYYLPQSMLVTIPLITLFLFIIGNFYIIYLIKLSKNYQKKIIFIYLLTIFYLPILLVIFLKPVIYDSWRQFIFLSIPLVIIAAFGFEWLTKIKNRFFFYAMVFIIAINFFFIGKEMVQLHPYEYIYFNSLTGGLKGAFGKYETDYWGLGYREAVLWFNSHLNNPNKKYKIYVEANPISSSYYFLSNMKLTDNVSQADYVFTYTRENLHIKNPGKTLYIVEREGVPLIYIKQIVR